jgi:hypothetical protein
MFDWLLATFRSYLDRCPPVTGNPLRRWQRQLPGFQSRRGHSDPDCAVVTGQVGITISPNVMSILFLMFLFAVGYGVGPQFVCSIVSDGLPQALFAAINCD